MNLPDELNRRFPRNEYGIFAAGAPGYWSQLNQEENRLLMEALEARPAREAFLQHFPQMQNIIFSPKRQAGLELLQLQGTETCIDYGCMWGALTLPLAKRTEFVLGVDQTLESLRFLRARLRDEDLANVELLCMDLRDIPLLDHKVDIAIINGVLEWIPEKGPIELKTYYGKYREKSYGANPREQQLRFLRQVHQNLKDGGKLYLAIENRYDFKMFIGVKDPHANLLFSSFLPRGLANQVSLARLGRPYVNWLYSFGEVATMLKESGFARVDRYMVFPDYRFPERILPYENSLHNFQLMISTRNAKGQRTAKRIMARIFELLIFKVFQAKQLAPSIIAIAHK